MKRKIVYVSLYEGLAILLSTLVFRAASDLNAGHAGLVALTASALAISWNYLYNTLFEALESRYSKGGRGFWLRTAHTLGFQLGMILLAIPLFALGLGLPKAQSLALQLTMSGFFVIYNFVFTLGFDRIFGLPPSAQKPGCASGWGSGRVTEAAQSFQESTCQTRRSSNGPVASSGA